MTARRTLTVIAVLLLCTGLARGEWVLEQFAGGGPDDLPAVEANVARPTSLAVDASGTVFILASELEQVLRVDGAGRIHMHLDSSWNDVLNGLSMRPVEVTTDAAGALRIVDLYGIWQIDPSSGGPVLQGVQSGYLQSAAVDAEGGVLFFTWYEQVVYRWDPVASELAIFAGIDCSPYNWPWPTACYQPPLDDVPATETWFRGLSRVALGPGGDLYVVDGKSDVVRRIDAATGIIRTVAGNGARGFSGDGGPALEASLNSPTDVAFGPAGHLYIADVGNQRVRRVDAVTGWIETVAGNGEQGFSGDGGPATEAAFDSPIAVALDGAGNLVIADSRNERVRRVLAASGIVETLAGNGTLFYAGDGHLATQASIQGKPVAIDAEGNLLVSDIRNNRVRRVDAVTGLISTIAGNGDSAFDVEDEGLPADQAVIPGPEEIVFDSAGNLFLADGEMNLRRIDGASGLITTVEGIRGGRLAIDEQDRLYIGRSRAGVDRFDPATGDTVRVAGGLLWPPNAEEVPATETELWVGDVAIGPSGDLFLSEYQTKSVRRVDRASGLIHTAAGGGYLSGEDRFPYPQPALDAPFVSPYWIGFDGGGSLFITDSLGDLLARVDPITGVLHRILGTGIKKWDDPPAPGTVAIMPGKVLPDGQGNLYLSSGNRILLVRNVNRPPVADAGGHLSLDCSGASGRIVQLDGSASFDPDALPGGDVEIQFRWWYEDFGLPTERLLDKGETGETELSIGSHAITLRVGDRWGAWGTDTITVTVVDAQDEDSDGVGSCADTCPELSNPDQTDADGNGLGDDCDSCMATPFDDPDGDGVCSDADNCAGLSNPLQLDRDSDGVGDACDVCSESSNPEQAESGTCMATGSGTEQCLPILVDPAGDGRSGRVLLTDISKIPPDKIVFTVRYQTCEFGDRFEAFLNGQLLRSTSSVWPTYSCGYSCVVSYLGFGSSDADAIAAAWNLAGPNELRFVKQGSASEVQWVEAHLWRGDSKFAVCVVDQEGGQCDAEPACVAGVTDGDMDVATTTEETHRREQEVLEVLYGPEPLSESLEIGALPDGEYRICVAATDADDPGMLYATTKWGELLEIDFMTGASSMAGVLPLRPTDIACDPVTKRGIASRSRNFVQAFDIRDGVRLGGILRTDHRYSALEHTGSQLWAGWTFVINNFPYGDDVWSWFGPLDPVDGTDHAVTTIEGSAIADMAYDPSAGQLLVLTGPPYDTPPYGTSIAVIDPSTGSEIATGPAGVQLGGLSFGPDGMLYGTVQHYEDPGLLYRIDLASEATTPIGDTGFTDIVGLTLAGSPGTVDCVEFVKEGQELLALNDSCGPPTAVAQAPAQAECASPAGAGVLLDGSGSSDPNSLAGTNDGIVAFDWFEQYGQAGETLLGSGPILLVDLPLGSHEITLRVTNRFGETGTDGVNVLVADTMPPELTVSLDPAVLWPPDHLMVGITASVEATDLCGEPAVALVSITSNEPDDAPGGGDGDTVDDIQGADYGSFDLAFELRAERSGSGTGRIYDVVYSATDGAGNRTDEAGLVVVPHLQDGIDKRWRWRVHKGTAAGGAIEFAALPVLPEQDGEPGETSDVSRIDRRTRRGIVRCVEVEPSDRRSRPEKEREPRSTPVLRCWVE